MALSTPGQEASALSPASSDSINSWEASDRLAQQPSEENATEDEQPADFGGEFPGDYNYSRDEEDANDENNGSDNGDDHSANETIPAVDRSVTLRKQFGPDEDYLLAIQVNKGMPFKAKFGNIRKAWQSVADTLNASPNFNMMPIQGTTAQARFDALLVKHKKWEAASHRASGISEKETEYVKVLTDLTEKVDDHKAAKAKAAAESAGVDRAKVLAGDVVRTAAVSRLQLGKRSGSSDNESATHSGRTKSQKVKGSEWTSMMQDMATDRSKVMEDFFRIQKSDMEQRQQELALERVEREKEREERRAEREERQQERQMQSEMFNKVLQLLAAQLN